MFRNNKYNLILIAMIFSFSIFAQEIVKVGNVYPGEVEMGGFNLSEDAIIEIEGEGASFDKWENYLNYYAWILNTETREVIWRSENSDDFSKEDGEYDFDSELELNAGNYEVYYSAGRKSEKYIVNGLGMIQGLFDGKKSNIYKFKKKFFLTITSDNTITSVNPSKLVNARDDAIVSYTRVGDSENLKKGFSLKAETKVKIYGVGEGVKSEFYDFGYIYDVVKNKKIWMFNKDDGNHAGGGRKNIVEKAEINLPKGSYEVHYKSDDSHSFDEWNVLPPDDPLFWGIVISLADVEDKKNIIPFRKDDILKPIVSITKVEEDEFLSQGFTLSKNIELRVMSIGEGYKDLVDFGWIENANTKEIVWKMTYRNSEYAGGGKKNRISDDIIQLDAGNYIAYYITDDSHNFDDWNDTPPLEEDKWGITIWTLNKNDKKFIKLFNSKEFINKNIIAELSRVGDDQSLSKRFTISQNQSVKIIAIGEGSDRELVDYAWITNSGSKTVWEMKYSETSHAGGGSKNRLYNSEIYLKSGDYKLHYRSDDSHSFEEWNTSPPDNPQMYGVTLLKVK
ncbi:MAG: hypothetical protein PF445_01500 [Melioribacteraceae bacterium]|jgi:major membrane immunogen (membrane-anchored lipoprotein)|nr:hypothetical protein [Melioribacteraceae bacterium]